MKVIIRQKNVRKTMAVLKALARTINGDASLRKQILDNGLRSSELREERGQVLNFEFWLSMGWLFQDSRPDHLPELARPNAVLNVSHS